MNACLFSLAVCLLGVGYSTLVNDTQNGTRISTPLSQVIRVFTINMTSPSDAEAATRVLEESVENENIRTDLETQKVKVTSTLTSDELLELLKKTGKTVTYDGPQ